MNSSPVGISPVLRPVPFGPLLFLAALLRIFVTESAEPIQCRTLPPSVSAWFPADDTRNALGGEPGSWEGDARMSPGFRGNAFEFDGQNDVVRVPGGPGLDLQDFTVEGWIRRQSTQRVGADGVAVLMGGNAGAWVFAINAEGGLYFGKVGTANTAALGAIRDNQWHHVAARRQGPIVQFYVDGVSVGESSLNDRFVTSAVYGIGGLPFPYDNITYSFQGWIDEMTVHREPLSPSTIQSLADPRALPWCREDLELTVLSAPSRVPGGGEYEVRAAVRNWNRNDATNVTMTVTLPAGGKFLAIETSQGTVTLSANVALWAVGVLPSGGSATVSIRAQTGADSSGWEVQQLALEPNSADQIIANNESRVRFLITGRCLSLGDSAGAFWRAERSTEDLVTGRTGTVVGRVDYVPGVIGSAFAFRENELAIQVLKPEALGTADFSVECWMRRASLEDVSPSRGHSFIIGGPVGGLGFGLVPDGRLYLHRLPTESVFSTARVTDTNWHHVAVTRAGSEVSFFLDGLPAGKVGYGGVFAPGSSITLGGLVGHDIRNSYTFLGDVDELALHSRALTPDEVNEIASAGSTGRCLNDVRLSVAPIPERVVRGDAVDLVFRVEQNGTETANEVRFLMVLPPGLQFLEGASDRGVVTETEGVIRCQLGRLLPGNVATLRVQVRATATRDFRLEARAEGLETDIASANNSVVMRITLGEFQLVVSPATSREGPPGSSNRMEFPVQFSVPRSVPVRLAFTVESLSASAGTDYLETSGEVIVPPGVTNAFVGVTILGDQRHELTEDLRIRVSNVNPEPLRSAEAIGLIQDDDPVPSVRIDPPVWTEGSAGMQEVYFDVRLIGTSDLPVRFGYSLESLSAQTGSDFLAADGTLEIAPGLTQGRIPVTLLGDGMSEGDELMLLRIRDVRDCFVPVDRVRGRIADDDESKEGPAGFRVDLPPGPVEPGLPFEVTVTALNAGGEPFVEFNSAVRLTARRGSGIPSRVVLSEVAADTSPIDDFIEVHNASPSPVDLAGWQIRVYGPHTWPQPTVTMTLARRVVLQPGETQVFNLFFEPGNEFASVANPSRVHPWAGLLGNELFGDPLVAVVLVDAGGRVEDSMLAGRARPEFLEFDLDPAGTRWEGTPAPMPASTGYRFQRLGDRNTRSTLDWALTAESTPQLPHPGLRVPLLDAIPLPVTPGSLMGFSGGVWRGRVTLPEPVAGAVLTVDDGAGHLGRSRPVDSQSDLDLDGLPDSWEVLHGLSFRDSKDAASDLDRDGFSAAQEWIAGTSPGDATSALALRVEADRVVWTAAPGRRYRLEQRSRLSGTSWELWRIVEPGAGGTRFEMLSGEPPASERWFRLLVEIP